MVDENNINQYLEEINTKECAIKSHTANLADLKNEVIQFLKSRHSNDYENQEYAVSLREYVRKGSVDIEKLSSEGIDIDDYRKPATSVSRLTISKFF